MKGRARLLSFTFFSNTFFFLDDRTFRSPNKLDHEDQTHFGREQEEWLFSQAAKVHEPLWLISGDQFFGGITLLSLLRDHIPKVLVRSPAPDACA